MERVQAEGVVVSVNVVLRLVLVVEDMVGVGV